MSGSRFRMAILGVILALAAVAAVVPAAAAEPAPNAQALARVMAVQDRNTNRLMALEGVVGTATGLNRAGRAVVKVFVTQAGVGGIPAQLEGVPVVVEVSGVFFALPKPGGPPGKQKPQSDPTSRFDRPVPIGVSTGHPDITAGTIGCRVTDGTDVYALSNNHVYANENNASIGDNVLQPGTYDGGVDPDDAIGTLDAFVPIVFSTTANNTIDAAIALSSTELLGNGTPSDGYGTPSSTTADASIGMRVKKYGRTTGETKGRVSAINGTFLILYDSGIARFVNQIVITGGSFSAGGDSGSLIVTQKGNNPVGLLFAGSYSDTLANPIDAVLAAFDVTVDGE